MQDGMILKGNDSLLRYCKGTGKGNQVLTKKQVLPVDSLLPRKATRVVSTAFTFLS